MSFASTIDERYGGGATSHSAGAHDAPGVIGDAMTMAADAPAYGALVHDGAAPDVDVYALGALERGVYTLTVLNGPWDSDAADDADLVSISLLNASGEVLETSMIGGLEVEVYDSSDLYLRITGGDHGVAQYSASYARTGDLPPDHAYSDVTYTLAPMQLDLTLTGSAAIDGTGNALDNHVTGNAADNTLRGEDGNDFLDGAGGVDTLFGGAGDDALGGAGVERMEGGAGDDVYFVNNARDRVVEGSGGGTDVVYAEVSHTLSAMVEDLVIDVGGNVDGRGNGLSNSLSGGGGANRLWGLEGGDALHGFGGDDRLDGGAGSDVMRGGRGDDTFVVDSALDRVHERAAEGVDLVLSSVGFALSEHVENLTLTGLGAVGGVGNAGANQLHGNAAANGLRGLDGADLLSGLAGNDRLDGGAGADRMEGGAGADTYFVDHARDRVVEQAGADVDVVHARVDHTLAAMVEDLVIGSAGAVDGTGNALRNHLSGGAGVNGLRGLDGDDVLLGFAGADRLDGGRGADEMRGGTGDDLFVVDSSLDRVVERRGEGVDTVSSSVSFKLSEHVENLTLTGSAAVRGLGNASANELRGNAAANLLEGGSGADSLFGGKGADRLVAGLGRDELVGGRGADVFIFDAIPEAGRGAQRDAILDFDHGEDEIRLSRIDADVSARGNQSFDFIKAARFTGEAGELRYKSGVVSGDVDGDRKADFQIALEDAPFLTAGDFIL